MMRLFLGVIFIITGVFLFAFKDKVDKGVIGSRTDSFKLLLAYVGLVIIGFCLLFDYFSKST